MEDTALRAVIYARLSKRTDANVPNLADQLERCREMAVKRGWQIVDEFSDFHSAFDQDSLEDRLGFADVLSLVKGRQVDVVLAWRPDRLWRDPIEAAIFMRACVVGKVDNIATVLEGDRDPNNPSDEMTTTIVAAVARYESNAKRARLLAKSRQLALAGKVGGGGRRPFGYESDRVTVCKSEANTIRKAAATLLDTGNLCEATRVFEQSSSTVTGAVWTPATARTILKSARIAGLRIHRGKIVGQAEWKAILDEPTWLAVQAILDDPARRNDARPPRRYLLTGGLAVCGLCGADLIARPRNDGKRCYCCVSDPRFGGCGKIRRLADPLEAEVSARVLEAIGSLADVQEPDDSVIAVGELAELESSLAGLARDHYVLRLITREEFFAARNPIEEAIARTKSRLVARPAQRLGEYLEHWPTLDLAGRRAAIAAVVEQVVVNPTLKGRNTFDPERIHISWKA